MIPLSKETKTCLLNKAIKIAKRGGRSERLDKVSIL